MNARHLALCSSAEWAAYVEGTLMPWVLGGHDLGAEVLELGPGPGRTTDLLLRSVPHLTVVELDEDLAAALARRTDGLDTPARRELHIDDTFTPIGIDELAARLTAAGLVDASVDVDGDRLRFAARAAPVR